MTLRAIYEVSMSTKCFARNCSIFSRNRSGWCHHHEKEWLSLTVSEVEALDQVSKAHLQLILDSRKANRRAANIREWKG